AGMGYNPAIPIAHAVQPATGGIRYLESRRPARFVGLNSSTVKGEAEPLPPLPPDLSMHYGLYDARGYDFPIERRYVAFWSRQVSAVYPWSPLWVPAATPSSLRGLSLLSVAD